MIFEKKLLKILHNLVSPEIFLTFFSQITFFTFKAFFSQNRHPIVFQRDPLLLIFLISKLLIKIVFSGSQEVFTRVPLGDLSRLLEK